MRRFIIDSDVVEKAAKARGLTAEKYVARVASISFGREVCAHLAESNEAGKSVFRISGVRTLK